MNLSFIKKENKQKYLIFLLILIALAIFFVFKKNSLPGLGEAAIPLPFQPKKIEINFDLLKSPIFEELRAYEEMKPFEGKVGQENPFIVK